MSGAVSSIYLVRKVEMCINVSISFGLCNGSHPNICLSVVAEDPRISEDVLRIESRILALTFSPDGSRLAVVTRCGSESEGPTARVELEEAFVQMWRTDNEPELAREHHFPAFLAPKGVSSTGFSVDNKYLAVSVRSHSKRSLSTLLIYVSLRA